MTMELTHGDIQELKARVEESLRQSAPEYQRLMRAFQGKDSAISPENIGATMQR